VQRLKKADPLIEESISKSKHHQGEASSSCMKEARVGQNEGRIVDLECNPTLYCAFSCGKAATLVELAKIVMDVECSITQREPLSSKAHESKCKAHSFANPSHSAQTKGVFGSGVVEEVCGCEENNGLVVDGITSEGKKTGAHDEDMESEFGNTVEQSSSPVLTVRERQRRREGMGAQKGSTFAAREATLLADEGEIGECKSANPQQQRKLKGLFDLGDASSRPRRSVRIMLRQSQSEGPSYQKAGTSSNSLSDGDFLNCNLRLCEPKISVESSKLWEIGKQSGIICRWDEEEVVKEYDFMEERDVQVMEKYEEGKKKEHLC